MGEALTEIGGDVVNLVDFADYIFGEDDDDSSEERSLVELSLTDFLDVILQLRGTNNASVKDVVDLRKCVMNQIDSQSQSIERTRHELERLSKRTRELLTSITGPAPPS